MLTRGASLPVPLTLVCKDRKCEPPVWYCFARKGWEPSRRLTSERPMAAPRTAGHPVVSLWAIARQALRSLQEGDYSALARTAPHLTKGSEGRVLHLAWNYSGGSIALHSNHKGLLTGAKGFRRKELFSGTATHKVINPLRESVKLRCIGGWVNLCGPIEAIFPCWPVKNRSLSSVHIISEPAGPALPNHPDGWVLAFSTHRGLLYSPRRKVAELAAMRTTVSPRCW